MEDAERREHRKKSDSLINYLKFVYSKNLREVSTLREVVIRNIVNNIEYWKLSNKSHKDINMASPFECLSTQDTLDILNRILDRGYNEKHYLNLLLHGRLTKFDLSFLDGQNEVFALHLLSQRSKRICNLIIPIDTDIKTKRFANLPLRFSKLKNVKVNHYSFFYVNEFVKSFTCHWKSLKSLEMDGSMMSMVSYTLLLEFQQLQILSIERSNNLDHRGLAKLLSLPLLRSLFLKASTLTFALLPEDLRLKNLLHLDISSSNIYDEGLDRVLQIMPNITNLSIAHCSDITVDCFQMVTKLSNLNILNAAYISSVTVQMFFFEENVQSFIIKQGFKFIGYFLS